MQSVRHENINRPQNPCEEDPEYNFAYCVEKRIVTKAGCKPYWSKFDIEGMPFCQNVTMLEYYSNISSSFQLMFKNELLGETNCLIPCSFTEYKVSKSYVDIKLYHDAVMFYVNNICFNKAHGRNESPKCS